MNGDIATNQASEVTNDAVKLVLDPGTYEVTFVDGMYTAFNRWSNSSGCDGNGENCTRGWENSAFIQIGTDWANHYLLGNGGGYGPVDGGGYFDSAADSFADALAYSYQFTLTGSKNVYFYIRDNILKDNDGGVSLSITAVSAPAGWLLSLAGFGMIGLLVARRRRTGTRMPS